MAELPPSIVAEWISEEVQNNEFILLRRAVENVLSNHSVTRSEEETVEMAEKIEAIVLDKLREKQEDQINKGIEPTFEIDISTGDSYIKSTNWITKRVLGKLRRTTPTEFEDFCVLILNTLGASAMRVGGSDDDGIDFIGYDLPVSRMITPALSLSKPIVLGQAKRYPERKIDVHDVRSFLGAALVKLDDIKREKSRYGLHCPAVFAFWTTSNFTDAASRFASKSGLWILGGLALAQLAIKLDLITTKDNE